TGTVGTVAAENVDGLRQVGDGKQRNQLRFKAIHRKGREIATVNRALATLRAAINWGRFQDPPYLTTTPFHRFGVSIKVKEETKRDRRVGLQEEQARLAACCER